MQTLEYLLVLTALLGILGAIVHPIHELDEKLAKTRQNVHTRFNELECSARAENAFAYFLVSDANGCLNYPYVIHPEPDAFALTLQGGKHYE